MKRLIGFITLFIIWLILSRSFSVDEMLLGALFAFVTVLITEKLFNGSKKNGFVSPEKYLWLAVYVAMLLWDILKSGLDCFYRLVHPSLRAKPGLISVSTSRKDEVSLGILAITITMLPGAIAVDRDSGSNAFKVYSCDSENLSASLIMERELDKYEKILEKVFG